MNEKDLRLLHLLNNLEKHLCFVSFLNAKLNESKTTTQNRLARLYYRGYLRRYKVQGNRSIYFLTEEGKALLEMWAEK